MEPSRNAGEENAYFTMCLTLAQRIKQLTDEKAELKAEVDKLKVTNAQQEATIRALQVENATEVANRPNHIWEVVANTFTCRQQPADEHPVEYEY